MFYDGYGDEYIKLNIGWNFVKINNELNDDEK